MSILQLATADVIKIGLSSPDKPSVMRELVQILVEAGKLKDSETEAALEALFKRESLQSTGLEFGIAVPHAKTPSVTRLVLALGISQEGIDFNSIDNKPSHLFFLLLSPPDKSGPHIGALAEIARLSTSSDTIDKIKNASTAQEVITLLKS